MVILPFAANSQTTITYSYNRDGAEPAYFGASRPQTYDVAMRITDPALTGARISGLRVAVPAEGVSNPEAFLCHELRLRTLADNSQINSPDITLQKAEISDGVLTATFKEPYTLTAEGVWVGYSITADEPLTDSARQPVAYVRGENPDGLWLHTSRSQKTWISYMAKLENGGQSAMEVILDTDFPAQGGTLELSDETWDKAGEGFTVPATLTNTGGTEITDIDYTWSVGGNSGSGSAKLAAPVKAIYLASSDIELQVPGIETVGDYELTAKIDKINGVEAAGAAVKSLVHVYPFLPVNRPLAEEYTSFNCGYCPAGWVALEQMKEDYGDRFVALSWHCTSEIDPLVITDTYANPCDGIPQGYINREDAVHPAHFYSEWPQHCSSVPVADIDVEAAWDNEAHTSLKAVSKVRFAVDADKTKHDYRIMYALVGDGLHSPLWMQSNYYGGDKTREGKYWEIFTGGGHYIADLNYNDIVLACDDLHGVEESVPSDFEAGRELVHTYSFDVEAVSERLPLNKKSFGPLPIDKDKLRVVAAIVEADTGYIVNSNSSDYASSGAPVLNIDADNTDDVLTEYYDLNGNRVSNPTNGIFIRAERRGDGTRRIGKAVYLHRP